MAAPLFTTLLLLLLATTTVCSIRLRVPGRCPNVCRSQLVTTFDECRVRTHRDCTMTFCGPPSSRRTACRLRPSGPRQIYPSETVHVSHLNRTSPQHAAVSLPFMFGRTSAKIDVHVLIDATASMGGIILSIQQGFGDVLRKVSASSDAAFGVAIFRDERELSLGFQVLQPITKDATKIQKALGTLEATGGLDAAEANLVALYRVATQENIGWRKGARRVVIHIADNPGHEPSCRDGKVWVTRQSVVAALNKAKISVIALSYPFGALDRQPSTFECEGSIKASGTGQGSFIAEKTGGVYAGGRDNFFDTTRVISLISELNSRVSVLSNTCMKHADVSFQPNIPRTIGNWHKLVTTIRPRASTCSLPGAFTCEITFLKSGAPVAPFRIVLDKPMDC